MGELITELQGFLCFQTFLAIKIQGQGLNLKPLNYQPSNLLARVVPLILPLRDSPGLNTLGSHVPILIVASQRK